MHAVLFADRMGWGFHPGMFVVGILIPLIIVGLVAYGIYELVRARSTGPALAAGPATPARAVLDERFARGEIDAQEYVQRRTLLDGTAPTGPPVAAEGAEPADVTSEHPLVAPEDPTPPAPSV
jgi:putative membrane protein